MTAEALLEELDRRHVQLTPSNGMLRYRAPKGALTRELIDSIVAQKTEILRVLERPSSKGILDLQRWGWASPTEVPLAESRPIVTDYERRLVSEAISRQKNIPGCEGVVRWIVGDGRQADRYEAEKGWPQADCLTAACIDVLLWQREDFLSGETHEERVDALLDRLDLLEQAHKEST